jgi:two-component system phosphate regulon response regulator PhoB
VTQNLLKQGYRLQTAGSADGDDAAVALRKVYASLGGRFGDEAQLSAVLVQSETGPTPSPARDVLSFAGLRLDRRRREVRVAGSLVELTKTEFDVLFFLASDPGVVFTRDEIVNGVKGEGHPVTPRSVDVQLVNLRRKLGTLSGQLQTNRGVGYRFVEPSSR